MRYLNIKHFDVANGIGIRTSLFVTGCRHNCKGCFNLIAQNFEVGEEFTETVIEEIIDSMRADEIAGLTLLGGEPMDPDNQEGIAQLVKRFREEFGDTKNIWSWTGYVYPRDFDPKNGKNARAYTEYSDYLMDNIDVLVDGPFVEGIKSAKLLYRGSANQQIIDMKASRLSNSKVLLDLGEDPKLLDEIYSKSFK